MDRALCAMTLCTRTVTDVVHDPLFPQNLKMSHDPTLRP